MTPQRLRLLEARKKYSQCANAIECRIELHGLSRPLSEQVVGIGVAIDWVRRAAEMEDVSFIGKQLNRSRHKAAFVAILRFSFCWFGLNAIFSRLSLLTLIGTPDNNNSEFAAFRVLFNAASLRNADARLTELHSLLSRPTTPRIAEEPSGSEVTTLRAIHEKYLQHSANRGATARQIGDAAQSGDIHALELPNLLYAFRNWSVHGAALEGSFGTRPGFLRFVEILQEVIADIHVSTAENLMASL